MTLDEDAIRVSDGPLRTAAGVTAGLDLALALVEDRRRGREPARGEAAPAGRAALQELQRWVAANPALDHSVANLAERMDLSPRHISRLFRSEVGITPATWVGAAVTRAGE